MIKGGPGTGKTELLLKIVEESSLGLGSLARPGRGEYLLRIDELSVKTELRSNEGVLCGLIIVARGEVCSFHPPPADITAGVMHFRFHS